MKVVLSFLAIILLSLGAMYFAYAIIFFLWQSAVVTDRAALDQVRFSFYTSWLLFLADIAALALLTQPSHFPTKLLLSASIFRVGCVPAGVEASKPVW